MFPRSVVLVAGCLFLVVFWVLLSGVYNIDSDNSQDDSLPPPVSKVSPTDLHSSISDIKAKLAKLEQDLPKLIKSAIADAAPEKDDFKVADTETVEHSHDHSADTPSHDHSHDHSHEHETTPPPPPKPQKKHAYAFYATNNNYACASLILARSINDVGGFSNGIRKVVLYTNEIDKKFVEKFKQEDFDLVETNVIQNEAVGPYHELWKHSVTKLLVFNMTQYDRIIFLDADAIAMKSPDSLFDLPPHFLYAPRAYWLWNQQPWINSQMLILEPNKLAFDKQMTFFSENEKKGKVFYDMDIANEVFRDQVAVLPGTFQLVNTDLVNPGPTKIPTLFDKTVDEIVKEAFIIHFTEGPKMAYGKPWHVKTFEEVQVKPEAHPVFREMYKRWFEYRDKLCV